MCVCVCVCVCVFIMQHDISNLQMVLKAGKWTVLLSLDNKSLFLVDVD